MASIQRVKLAINAANIPFVSTQASRAVVVPSADSSARSPVAFSGNQESLDHNVAQVIYAENVLPVAEGIRSVSFRSLIPPSPHSDFDSVFPLRDADENHILFSPSFGRNYIHNPTTNTWAASPTIPAIWAANLAAGIDITRSRVTYCYVDGQTFVCYSRLHGTLTAPPHTAIDMSIMRWNPATQSLQPSTGFITNLPFPIGEIDGIASSAGFLIVWSGISIAWAPFTGTAFDFSPIINMGFSGAGRQIPQDIKGPITTIISAGSGFIAFTARNAIGASFHANNISSPWVFREIPSVGGLESYEQATVETQLERLVALTTSGLQTISINSGSAVFPSLADFITGRRFETYSAPDKRLFPTAVNTDIFVKINAIGSRYLAISYGFFPGIFSFALVYDSQLQRWGKIRLVHRDCFNYIYKAPMVALTYGNLVDVSYAATLPRSYAEMNITPTGLTPAQHAMAFLLETGEVRVASWSTENTVDSHNAVAILGAVQLSRTRNIQLNRIEVEGMHNGTISVQTSSNGRTIDTVVPTTIIEQAQDLQIAGCMVDCKNFNLVIEGNFNLSTLIVEALPTGRV